MALITPGLPLYFYCYYNLKNSLTTLFDEHIQYYREC